MSTSAANRLLDGFVDVQQSADYPIVLGDSLRTGSRSQPKHIQLRYNWTPPRGFRGEKGQLKERDDQVRLSYKDGASSPPVYEYNGFYSSADSSSGGKNGSRFVLIFDRSKSAFVLEEISTSIDLNLTSAISMNHDEIRKQHQLPKRGTKEDVGEGVRPKHDDDDQPDPSNPFDFRHFLAEARENSDKSSQLAGSRTPVPGSSTPRSLVASPQVPSRQFANTTSAPRTNTSTVDSKKQPAARSATKTASARKPTAKKKDVPSRVAPPLSKERISDSDEEMSETVAIASNADKVRAKNKSPVIVSDRSTNIVYSGGGLEILEGSPPQEPKRRYKIDTEAFRSGTHTPVPDGRNSRAHAPRIRDEDIIMDDLDQSENDDEDDDVEALELDGPGARREDMDAPQPVETPPASAPNIDDDDDDDDDALAAELMEALEEEESAGANGTSHGYGHVDEDESDVSEEL